MSSDVSSAAADVAEAYYDSDDADAFYQEVWGGEDIHVGLYSPGDTIPEASRRTVLHMADRLGPRLDRADVIDFGAGYGGAARVLATRHEARVTCLNLSDVENDRNRELTRGAGLDDRVSIVHGRFEDAPAEDAAFDVVWSQDAILHSGDRDAVLAEVARVLRPGGDFIFTDPMQADDAGDPQVLQPIYDRLHLRNLGSFAYYRRALGRLGFEEVKVEDFTPQLARHYAAVADELRGRRDALKGRVSEAYVDRMLTGLGHWVRAGEAGVLAWGVMHFRKPG